MSDAYDLTPGELLSIPLLPTGVIVGTSEHITAQQADEMKAQLERIFPNVHFAVISSCSALVSFTYDPEATT